MNLRLRRYSDELDDVRASKRDGTLEGLLLSGMSKFGLGMLDEASKDFGKAALAKADRAQARALYWLGTIANAQERSADALTYLGRALEPGDGPADAYRQVAELYVARGKAARAGNESDWRPWFSRAITAASRSLDSRSGYTEDEMVALFAGIPLSEYPARAKEFRYTALLARADAHFNLGDYASCIKDCTDVVSICPTLAEAYYWRGCARYASGDGEEAVRDLDGAMDRAADGSPVKRLAQDLKKQILGE
jgi:tetratricopeptide (TPR) repeat protein